jgi:hypothetical protein
MGRMVHHSPPKHTHAPKRPRCPHPLPQSTHLLFIPLFSLDVSQPPLQGSILSTQRSIRSSLRCPLLLLLLLLTLLLHLHLHLLLLLLLGCLALLAKACLALLLLLLPCCS